MKYFLPVILALLLTGCAGSFQADKNYPVDSGGVTSAYDLMEPEVGILYDYFVGFNAFTAEEERKAEKAYQNMIVAILKIQKKTIAGKTDYHRLLYFLEDMTDYWQDLREVLDSHVKADLPGKNPFAEALYLRVSRDVDNMLTLVNIRLRQASDDMDGAMYSAFRQDAKNLISSLLPLFQKGLLL
jgi:hypothetical protein